MSRRLPGSRRGQRERGAQSSAEACHGLLTVRRRPRPPPPCGEDQPDPGHGHRGPPPPRRLADAQSCATTYSASGARRPGRPECPHALSTRSHAPRRETLRAGERSRPADRPRRPARAAWSWTCVNGQAYRGGRSRGATGAGRLEWCLPKGHLEGSETPEQAAAARGRRGNRHPRAHSSATSRRSTTGSPATTAASTRSSHHYPDGV